MSNTVDLIVIGVEGDIPRADMSKKLVNQFKQPAYTFEALLDGAYGESAPYVAQSDVGQDQAQGGKEQLEKFGLQCTILPTGQQPEPIAVAPAVVPTEPEPSQVADVAGADVEPESDVSALASFKSDDSGSSNNSADVLFDDSEADVDGVALASFKKEGTSGKKPADGPVDFSAAIEGFGDDAGEVGLADAKSAKVKIHEKDDSIDHDFSDELDDVGADELGAGLKEGRQAKPDFDAEVSDVDFSDDAISIGIQEDPEMPAVSKTKLAEETSERNLNSFPKEDNNESIDFSSELEVLESDDPLQAKAEGPINAADVPEALADGASEDLQAELIDPAPIAKKPKAVVEADDGGLTLSTDDEAPLTARKEKPTVAVEPEPVSEAAPVPESPSASAPEAKADIPSPPKMEEPVAPKPKQPEPVAEKPAAEKPVAEKPVAEKPAAAESQPEPKPEPKQAAVAPDATANSKPPKPKATSGGLVLPGQLSSAVVPQMVPEDKLDNVDSSVTSSLRDAIPANGAEPLPIEEEQEQTESFASQLIEDAQKDLKNPAGAKKAKGKIAAAIAGAAVLAGVGTYMFTNPGSIASLPDRLNNASGDVAEMKDASSSDFSEMRVEAAALKPNADLEKLTTGELLVNLSDNRSNGIEELEPYFTESAKAVRRGPRLGAAVPAESRKMLVHRQSHPADEYFDNWSTREGDLSLFLALMDNLIEKGDFDIAHQLSDRAKDKLFAVMSTQRLARAYSDIGEHEKVTRLMTSANRDTYAIKSPEERVLALSDYAFTEQAIGLNESAMDTFLKTSILARSLVRPEKRTIGLNSAALYFHRSGRTALAQDLLQQSLQSANELPENTAARDLATRYIALTEARMGLFNQAVAHTKLIVDPVATVSTYHGIALAIEGSGDHTNARKILNMAYRAGSEIENKEERSKLLSKVVLASESD